MPRSERVGGFEQPRHLPGGHVVHDAPGGTGRFASAGQTSRAGQEGPSQRTRGRGSERRRRAASSRREPVEAAEQPLQATDGRAALRRASSGSGSADRNSGSACTSFAPISSRSARCSTISAARRRPTWRPPPPKPPSRRSPLPALLVAAASLPQKPAAQASAGRRGRRQKVDRDLAPAHLRAGSSAARTRAKLCSGSGSAEDAQAARCSAAPSAAQRAPPRTLRLRSTGASVARSGSAVTCACTRSNTPSAERTAGSARSGTLSE